MPTAKPRITITLEPHSHEVLSRLSRVGGDSMSVIVAQLLEVALPTMERLVLVLERAAAAPEEARAGLAAAVERAERDTLPVLLKALDQRDLFLADVESAAGGGDPLRRELLAMAKPAPATVPGARAQHARQEPAAASKGGRRRGSTPVPVTRGSGGYKSAPGKGTKGQKARAKRG